MVAASASRKHLDDGIRARQRDDENRDCERDI
jgi:hypothetical protein